MSLYAVKLLAAVIWRLGYQVDRRIRLFPVKNIQFKTPILGVGSFLSGGAGKTPLVRHLAEYFSGLGLRVGVLCRPTGDEERWLASQGRWDVHCAKSRLELCKELDGRYDLLISDDGMEDRRLSHAHWLRLDWGERAETWRDLLPAGSCRSLRHDHPEVKWSVRCRMQGDPEAECAQVVFSTGMPRNALGGLPLAPVMAMAGVARPERFFSGLKSLNVPLAGCIARPDHDRRFGDWVRFYRSQGVALAITEKDASRLGDELLNDPGVYVSGLALTKCELPYSELTTALRIGIF